MQTNIIRILTTKAKTSTAGYGRVKDGAGKLIDGLYVNHVKDYDYLLFDHTSKKIDTNFTQKYNAFETKIDTNPMTTNIALHIRIPSNVRGRLSQFYDDLCANYDPKNTDDSVGEVIEEWAYLFDTIKNKRLSRDEVVGLIGELLTLQQLYNNGHGSAIEHWFGPAGELHDFKNDNNWILEVKTSVSPNPVVKVGQIDQLEPQSLPFNLVLVKIYHFNSMNWRDGRKKPNRKFNHHPMATSWWRMYGANSGQFRLTSSPIWLKAPRKPFSFAR